MKKLFLILIPFLFFACDLNNQNYYLLASVDNNGNVFINSNNKTLSNSEKIAYNDTITITWKLLPSTQKNAFYIEDANGNVTSKSQIQIILSSDDYIEMIHPKKAVNSISFKAINQGYTKITIKSDEFSSSTVDINSYVID